MNVPTATGKEGLTVSQAANPYHMLCRLVLRPTASELRVSDRSLLQTNAQQGPLDLRRRRCHRLKVWGQCHKESSFHPNGQL